MWKLSWGIASSLLFAACTDVAVSPPAPDLGDRSSVDVAKQPSVATTPADGTVAMGMSASWTDERPGDPGVTEYGRLIFQADAVPTGTDPVSWTPTIHIQLYVHKTSFTNPSASQHIDVIEPQSATLVDHGADWVEVELADATRVYLSQDLFGFAQLSDARRALIDQLPYWSEMSCAEGGENYTLATTPSYVVTSFDSSLYSVLDVPETVTPYGLEKDLVVGDAHMHCLFSTTGTTSSCAFEVKSPDIIDVKDDALTFEGVADGEGLETLRNVLACMGDTIPTDQGDAHIACTDSACRFTWTRPRPAL